MALFASGAYVFQRTKCFVCCPMPSWHVMEHEIDPDGQIEVVLAAMSLYTSSLGLMLDCLEDLKLDIIAGQA